MTLHQATEEIVRESWCTPDPLRKPAASAPSALQAYRKVPESPYTGSLQEVVAFRCANQNFQNQVLGGEKIGSTFNNLNGSSLHMPRTQIPFLTEVLI